MRERLLSPNPALHGGATPTAVRTWVTGLEHAARTLAHAVQDRDRLRRILADLVLHCNRMGDDRRQQATWALAAHQILAYA